MTIRDVAARAGVSVATVSKVINSRYGVAAGTTARVQAVIDELGYQASLVAQSLRNHRTNVIGILVLDLEPFSTELLKGAADAIRGSGFELVIYSAGGNASDRVGWERRYLSRLSGTLIDGAVLVTPTVVDVNYGSPVVAIDPQAGQSDLPTVDSDSLRGAQLATGHLLELGHRRIAHVIGIADHGASRWRLAGYREAMAAAGLPEDPALVVQGAFTFGSGVEAARQLFSLAERPTAVFAANDDMATGVMWAAGEYGLKVPHDLSVCGFDDTPLSRQLWPALTTVQQPSREMGKIAAEQLLSVLRGHGPGQLVQVPYVLQIRGSTARVP